MTVVDPTTVLRSRIGSCSAEVFSVCKPIVAFDIDEVLFPYLQYCIKWHNEKYGTNLKYEDFHSYNFCETWGGSDREAFLKCKEYMLSDFFRNIPPLDGSQKAVSELLQDFELVVVTSRQTFMEEETIRWFNTHFPNCFSQFFFGNHWNDDSNAKSWTKREMCEAIGAIALVDDNPKYIEDVAGGNIHHAFLLDLGCRNGWSRDYLPSPNASGKVFRCTEWSDVVGHLQRLVLNDVLPRTSDGDENMAAQSSLFTPISL